MNIDWTIPELRTGWRGQIDKIIGPGATKAEINLQLYLPLLAVVAVLSIGVFNNYNWTWGQYAISAFIVLDMVGGIATNLTSTAKRWNFREGNGFKEHMIFISIHIIQLLLVSYFFLDFDLAWAFQNYAFLLLAGIIILKTPLYLQRAVSGMAFVVALILSMYVFAAPLHLEWFLPLFYYKLLVSHVVREEPYSPEQKTVLGKSY
jgi:cell division protein FtsW (lipid II flippase)